MSIFDDAHDRREYEAQMKAKERPPMIDPTGRVVIRFDGPPGPVSGHFIEVELNGRGVNLGEWQQDGAYWLLVLPEPYAALASALGQRDALAKSAYHKPGCAIFTFRACNCGWATALARLREEKP